MGPDPDFKIAFSAIVVQNRILKTMSNQAEIMVVCTGNTIGMVEDSGTGVLNPFNFKHITDQIPEIRKFGFNIESFSSDPLIDSSNMERDIWVRLARIIEEYYETSLIR